LGMAVGALSGGVISDKLFGGKRAKLIAITLVFCAVCVFIMPALGRYAVNHPDTGKLVSVPMLILSGFMLYASIALYFALCPDLLGRENSGTGIGIMDAAAYAGAGAGTAIIGWLATRHGWNAAFGFMASCSLAGAVLIVFLREDGKQEEETNESTD